MRALIKDMQEGLISLCHTNSGLKAFAAQLNGKSEVTCKAVYVVNLDRQLQRNQVNYLEWRNGRN